MATKAKTKTKKGDTSTLIAAALAPHGFPHEGGRGLGFTRDDDALFERGYPHLRFVTDEKLASAKAVDAAEKALAAIDPVLRAHVPRVLAEHYLRGYRVGAQLSNDRAQAIRSDRAIDLSLLEETLRANMIGMGTDTYARWRLPEVLHLYEHFIGSDAVARALTDHLIFAATDLSTWDFAGKNPARTNAAPHHAAYALPWVLRRVDASLATELRARIGRVEAKSEGETNPRAYFELLRALASPPSSTDDLVLALAYDLGDSARAALEREPYEFLRASGRIAWLLGTSAFAGTFPLASMAIPSLVDQIAPLKDPGIVRFVAHLASQKSGAKAAGAWLAEHAEYARPILETLRGLEDAKEKKIAENALALLSP